jgi:hypothetical protein
MKKGDRFYSPAHGLIVVIDGRERKHIDGGKYILVRTQGCEYKKQWISQILIPLDDAQWNAVVRISASHWMLRQWIIDQFRLGKTPKNIGHELQAAADQLLCNPGVR